jgi:DNA polymerase-1
VNRKLFLIDAMALIYRAYYAFINSPRLTSKGLNTSAILGFANSIWEILQKEQPTHIAVCFDTHAPTVRHIEFDQYKANRQATPVDILNALPYIKKLLKAWNITVYEKEGYEADDIIGTLAKMAEKQSFITYMMTPDKDFGQLVSPNIFVYKPAKFGNPAEKLGVKEVCEKYDISRPEQVIDILALMGDAADNFPGIPGIGEKTASKLLAKFDNLENLLENAAQIENAKLREKISDFENQKLANLSYKLATIDINVPIDFVEEELRRKEPQRNELLVVLAELEFEQLARKILGTSVKFSEGMKELKNEGMSGTKSSAPDLFSQLPEEQDEDRAFFPNVKDTNNIRIDDFHRFFEENKDKKEIIISVKTDTHDSIKGDFLIMAIGFPNDDKLYYFNDVKAFPTICLNLNNWFSNNCKIISYNLKDSINVLKRYGIEVNCQFFDIQLYQYVVDSSERNSPDSLSKIYLKKSLFYDVYQGKYIHKLQNISILPSNILVNYVCEEVNVMRDIYALHSEKTRTNEAELLDKIEFPLIDVLSDMELEGIRIDKHILSDISKQLSDNIREIEEDIYELAGEVFNISSPKQLGVILYDRLQITDRPPKTATKQYSTAEDVLQKFSYHPIIGKILEYRSLTKLKSTYVDALPALINPKTERLHTTFNQAVASTGRLSSSNPNLQNIPIRTERGREIRKAFVARNADYTLLSADYSQIELRLLAAISGDARMLNDFAAKHDIHAATAAKIYGVKIGEVTKEMRRNAKSINFGISYGMSAFGLSEQLGITRNEAKFIIDQYFLNYPSIKKYMDERIENTRKNGYAETLMHRKRYLPEINDKNKNLREAAERNAINMPIQGTAADMLKIAMLNIAKEIKKQQLKSKMLLQVHDELIFDIPKVELEAMKVIINENMSNALKINVPIEVNIANADNWLDAH